MSRDSVFSDVAVGQRKLHGRGARVSDRIADAMTAFSGSMAFVARLAVRSRIEFETDIQSDVWSELIAEKLGIDKAEVNRRVRRRLADADRQAESHESPAQADVPSA